MKQIKVTLNGIKVDGKYIPCSFSTDSGTVMVYARDYGRNTLPTELGNVRNDTDSQSDYFETDHVRVYPTNKYYKDCYKAAINTEIKIYKHRIKHCEKQMIKYSAGYYFDMYKKELEAAKEYLNKWQTIFENCKKSA